VKKQNLKFVHSPLLGRGLEYTAFIDEAKRIASELVKAKEEGFLKDNQEDAVRLAGVLAIFGATVDEVHVPLTEKSRANKWDELRKSLG
jgi:hypothetical protein